MFEKFNFNRYTTFFSLFLWLSQIFLDDFDFKTQFFQ